MEVEISLERRASSKLTVTANGDVRIKFARILNTEECDILQERFLKVAKQVIAKNHGKTMRGRAGTFSIEMMNDARTESEKYFWIDLEL